ncbi:glycosyltransferase family 2 protein [Acidobacterium sp. S8]|uniref:glycosyltransferase family 2 protein n=1 Tax=Acidobacterium sp. S8 TaxID=1641854 RepID=UPI00131CF393|nr:glycosyltransferase family 2 protein [Acidobacterium sp. S8]
MKISIVTLSFNQKRYLQDAIESVLQQNHPDVEYIVVDPGSTDGSREEIESYGTRIACKIFEPDEGAADGLNKGFRKATGAVYGFLNADDLLMPLALSRVASFFQSNPQCDLVMGNGFIIDADGAPKRHIRARDFTVRRYLHGGTRWLQQSTFFRAKAFAQSPRFNIDNRTCWDGELFVSMAKQGAAVAYLEADLAKFRIHSESISGSGSGNERYKADRMRIFEQLLGRKWSSIDELWRFLYRGEGVVLRAWDWPRTLAARDDQGF